MPVFEDDPTNPAAVVTFYLPGGGVEIASGYDAAASSYARDFETRAQLLRTSTSPIRYERRSPDGSIEVFAQADGASTSPRRVFRTESIDPQGQKLTFTYDASLRLVAITDAIGQVTTLAYELPSDPLKITNVSDPFGRFATLEYDAAGRLVRITDVIGLASEFEYVGNGFLTVLETPYGRTEFAGDPFGNANDDDLRRWVEVTDPLGGRERVEYVDNLGGFPASEPEAPFGFAAHNVDLYRQNSFYWDKRAMSLYPGDYTKAEISHWLQKAHINILQYIPVAQLHSTKRPLESRVWMKYVGQPLQKKRGTVKRHPVSRDKATPTFTRVS